MDETKDVLTSFSTKSLTLVLVGRTGNGKSATGNTILGRKSFKSKLSSSGVTATAELQTTTLLSNGQVLNVIDTPGLFEFAVEASFVSKEMINCTRLAKDGIHAFIVVFSVRTRFTKEEYATIKSLQSLFGPKLVDYMIIVFTGGDELEDNEQSLEDYIGSECPEPIKEILRLCKHRKVLFNNKANESKREEQVQHLLTFVDMITKENGGQAFSNDFFGELKSGEWKLDDQEQLTKLTEMVEQRLGKNINRLEQQLKEEQAARMKAQELADQKFAQEKAARLMAEQVAAEKLEEERTARAKAEQLAQKKLAEEKAARLKAEEAARKALAEEKAALENAKQHAEKQLAEERAARLKEKERKQRQLDKAVAARANAERISEEAHRRANGCSIL